jgi:glycosyltransferase involved in cell wall biosynthesis
MHLSMRRPDLVIISQGDNYDGLYLGYLCRKLRIPYTLISQKASDYFWPEDKLRSYKRAVFEGAVRCFFVSEHNWRLTEDQYGVTLKNANVVQNPYMVCTDQPLPWPASDDDGLRLACVARLHLLDKGQDILLRVLARNKWRERRLHVSFFGQGINREGLESLAARLGVQNVSFEGQYKGRDRYLEKSPCARPAISGGGYAAGIGRSNDVRSTWHRHERGRQCRGSRRPGDRVSRYTCRRLS